MSARIARRPAQARIRLCARRAQVAFAFFVAFALYITARYFFVQIAQGPHLATIAFAQDRWMRHVPAVRGSIYDRDGTLLVGSVPAQSVYVDMRYARDLDRTALALSHALGLAPGDVLRAFERKNATVQIAHKVPRDRAVAVERLGLPGVTVEDEDTGNRFAPSPRLASTLLGFTGFDDDGLEGLEYAFDPWLRGTKGMTERVGDKFGRADPFASATTVAVPRTGYSLVLTLDSFLQFNAERVLRATVAKWHAESGSAIVLDPWSGEILALANAPDFDMHAYAKASAAARRDRAVTDAYEPGSTFKLITAAAALESGKVSPSDRFAARDRLEVGGSTIHNAEDGFLAGSQSTENLDEIVTKSHNVGAAEVGLRVGSRTMYATMRRFGFGDPTGVELPGENPGIVPDLASWSATSLPTMSFGHGIAVTPLALARAYAAFANGGMLLRPRIVSQILDDKGRPAYRYGREVERRVISARTAGLLRGYLRHVVERGTGNPTAQVPGYTTAGKTGTAQVAENGFYVSGAYVASFVGMIPATSPRYVILVKIARPVGAIYGGVVAAPAFAELARIAMMHAGIPPAPPPRSVHEGRTSKQSA